MPRADRGLPILARRRIFNRPALILPEKAREIIAGLRGRLGVDALVDVDGVTLSAQVLDDVGNQARGPGGSGRQRVFEVADGIAILPVIGTLVNRLGSVTPYSGMTGYDGIEYCLEQALADPEVRGIMLDIDSCGGEVAGCFDVVDRIHAAREQKPIWAVLGEDAYSGAYAIASAATHVTVPRTGGAGSIGVVCAHVDVSVAMGEAGYTVTLIHSGARKVDGNPYEPLPDDVRGRMQGEIDELRLLFAGTVARNREMNIQAVLDTEAATYPGAAAVAAGLADAVMAPREAFAAFRVELDRPSATTGRNSTMTRAAKAGGPKADAGNDDDDKSKLTRANFMAGRDLAEGDASVAEDDAEDDTSDDEPEDGEDDDPEDKQPQATAATRKLEVANPREARELRRLGAAAERHRITSIQKLGEPGEEKLIASFCADEKVTISRAALNLANTRKAKRQASLGQRQASAPAPVAQPSTAANAGGVDPNLPVDQRTKAEWDRDPALRAEFGDYDRYLAFVKASEAGLARVLRK
jgi:ClpP class serine protease